MKKYEVGQTLWFVTRETGREVMITKVGRKWLGIGCLGRINRETLELDCGGYTPTGKCYLSQEAYEALRAKQEAWRELRGLIEKEYCTPDHVSIEWIKAAIATLEPHP